MALLDHGQTVRPTGPTGCLARLSAPQTFPVAKFLSPLVQPPASCNWPSLPQWTNNNHDACTSCRRGILSRKVWLLMLFNSKFVSRTLDGPEGSPTLSSPVRQTTARVKCFDPGGFTPAEFQIFVFPGLRRIKRPAMWRILFSQPLQHVGDAFTSCLVAMAYWNGNADCTTSINC